MVQWREDSIAQLHGDRREGGEGGGHEPPDLLFDRRHAVGRGGLALPRGGPRQNHGGVRGHQRADRFLLGEQLPVVDPRPRVAERPVGHLVHEEEVAGKRRRAGAVLRDRASPVPRPCGRA